MLRGTKISKRIIFLDGPVGTGKSTLGRALAARMGAHFIEGDDHTKPGGPWYASILSTSHSIVRAALQALESKSLVIIAYPLTRRQWFFFERSFSAAGIDVLCVGLRAAYSSVVAAHRQREFSATEHERIQVMIAEGYGLRPFSTLIVDTDQSDFETTLSDMETRLRALSGQNE